jgi:hypothetical protein
MISNPSMLGRFAIQSHDEEDIPRIGQCVFGAAGQCRREACHHRGGNRQHGQAASRAGANREDARLPVRLLYAGNRNGESPAASEREVAASDTESVEPLCPRAKLP